MNTFNTGRNCIFSTYLGCRFITGDSCTFITDKDCNFKTGSNCTFNTAHGCTFEMGRRCALIVHKVTSQCFKSFDDVSTVFDKFDDNHYILNEELLKIIRITNS